MVFRGHFLHPSKRTLRINGPVSFFYGTLPDSLRASMPNMGAIACSLGHQNGGDSKRPTCDTCSATGHHEDNSMQHRKGMMTLGRKQVSLTTPFMQRPIPIGMGRCMKYCTTAQYSIARAKGVNEKIKYILSTVLEESKESYVQQTNQVHTSDHECAHAGAVESIYGGCAFRFQAVLHHQQAAQAQLTFEFFACQLLQFRVCQR